MSEKSMCCGAKVIIDTRGTTIHYVCLKCKQKCDIIWNTRKTWTRNPAEQVLPDKRSKIKKQITKKEINEIRKSEDF